MQKKRKKRAKKAVSTVKILWSALGIWEQKNKFGKASQRGCVLALWARSIKNPDESTAPLPRPFAHSLAPLTCLLAPHSSLCSHAPLRSFIRLLVHFAHSLAHGTVNDWMAIYFVFFSILDHSVLALNELNNSPWFRTAWCWDLLTFISPTSSGISEWANKSA